MLHEKAKQKKVPEEALNKCCLIKFFDRIERNSVNKLTLRIKDPQIQLKYREF